MTTLRQLFEQLWNGNRLTSEAGFHPFHFHDLVEEIAAGTAVYKSFVNTTVVTTGAGAVLIDTGSFQPAMRLRTHEAVRGYTKQPIHTAIYTHGHVDHAYGLPPFLAEAEQRGWQRPAIVAHEGVPVRMQRYLTTAGYNSVINERQFGIPVQWPTDPVYPTLTYQRGLSFSVGDQVFELHHARGETDDHTFIYLPKLKVLFPGDLFIWAVPNAGNPQKVQRYAVEWALALRTMAALGAELLVPGHGVPIFGAREVEQALLDTAEYLESLSRQTLAMLNAGATIYDIVHGFEIPARLAARPYLQPVYDEPEFIVRNLCREFAGWYSGVPSELKPARPEEQAREIVALAGGVESLLARVRELLAAGNLRLACHLVDWAAAAEPGHKRVHELRALTYHARCEAESSLMSKGIFSAASRESSRKASGL